MKLTRRNEGGWFPSLRSNFPEFFDTDRFFDTPIFKSEWQPAVNIKENDDSFEIEVAAPGLTKKDFNVTMDEGVLTISSEKKEEKEEKEENYTRKEFSYSSFRRSFALPENVDKDKIKARYDDGILNVTLQKNAVVTKEKAKEISIS